MLGDSAWQWLSTVMVPFVGWGIVSAIRGWFRCSADRARKLYFWHTLMCVAYAFYVVSDGGDAVSYYAMPVGYGEFRPGTMAVRVMSQYLKDLLGLSFLGVSFVFNICGALGLIAFDSALREVTLSANPVVRQRANWLPFLPSVSFWSSAIGKDSVAFLAVGLTVWAAFSLGSRLLPLVVSVVVLLVLRPHIAAILVTCVAVGFLLQPRLNMIIRVALGVLALASASVVVPYAMGNLGLEDPMDTEEIAEYIEKRQSYNITGGAGVDIAQMTPPMQLFTYVFRPLPFEANSFFSLAASFDNTVLLLLFASSLVAALRRKTSFYRGNVWFLLLYGVSSWIVLAVTTSNLGIAMRQKWMFVPMLIVICVSALSGASRRAKLLGPRQPSRPRSLNANERLLAGQRSVARQQDAQRSRFR